MPSLFFILIQEPNSVVATCVTSEELLTNLIFATPIALPGDEVVIALIIFNSLKSPALLAIISISLVLWLNIMVLFNSFVF